MFVFVANTISWSNIFIWSIYRRIFRAICSVGAIRIHGVPFLPEKVQTNNLITRHCAEDFGPRKCHNKYKWKGTWPEGKMQICGRGGCLANSQWGLPHFCLSPQLCLCLRLFCYSTRYRYAIVFGFVWKPFVCGLVLGWTLTAKILEFHSCKSKLFASIFQATIERANNAKNIFTNFS